MAYGLVSVYLVEDGAPGINLVMKLNQLGRPWNLSFGERFLLFHLQSPASYPTKNTPPIPTVILKRKNVISIYVAISKWTFLC